MYQLWKEYNDVFLAIYMRETYNVPVMEKYWTMSL